ncbi:MAG: hypothetical protein JRI59_03305 [Deltaproteobacteria bacterium]|nr:hypothetical protein [Deltaproteobacteria bacterium]
MKRLIFILAALLILAPAPGLVQSQATKPPTKKEAQKAKSKGAKCPMYQMLKEMPEGKGVLGKLSQRWWRMGILSQLLTQVTTETADLMGRADLKPASRKELAMVIKKVGELLPAILSPKGPDQEAEATLRKLKATLDRIKSQIGG